MSEHCAQAVEYDVAYLNGKVVFVIDDHHLPFSAADKLQTRVAGFQLNYQENFRPTSAHAIYEFELRNTTTEYKTAFSIVMCPFAAMYDAKISHAYSTLLRATVEGDQACAKRVEALIMSRSLYSLAMEKDGGVPALELPKLAMSLNIGYFRFMSNFYALNNVYIAIRKSPTETPEVRVVIIRDRCPYCAKMSTSPASAFV